jgi:hypothetical protein
MAGPDLRGAQKRVESLLDDTVTIRRARPHLRDDTLNDQTGELEPVDASTTVWSGQCLVTARADADGTPDRDPSAPVPALSTPRYRALIPLAADPVEVGDVLTIDSSRRDTQLVGERFEVDAPGQVGTYAVVRIVGLVRLP